MNQRTHLDKIMTPQWLIDARKEENEVPRTQSRELLNKIRAEGAAKREREANPVVTPTVRSGPTFNPRPAPPGWNV